MLLILIKRLLPSRRIPELPSQGKIPHGTELDAAVPAT